MLENIVKRTNDLNKLIIMNESYIAMIGTIFFKKKIKQNSSY